MAERSPQDEPEEIERRLQEQVARKVTRKIRARSEEDRGIVFWLGMFGLVGWSVAVPALLGTAFGIWLDGKQSGTVSWTLTFLFIGIVIGCLNAWYWIKGERYRD